ncbi:MAG TPA: SIS domain-containing protein [Gemmatimonadales bacterium]|jgi:D-sedoheptulose 7-phosphate isomerase
MSDSSQVATGLRALAALALRTADQPTGLDRIVGAMRDCLARDGTLFFAGNGGSAADAQHLAAEYVVRYRRGNQRALRAIALTTDTSAITAAANDVGYEVVFARQLEALGRSGDVLVLHSTSGNSANCLAAAEMARRLQITVIAFLGGDGGALAALADHPFVVTGAPVNHVQEIHLAVQHQIAAILTAEHGG